MASGGASARSREELGQVIKRIRNNVERTLPYGLALQHAKTVLSQIPGITVDQESMIIRSKHPHANTVEFNLRIEAEVRSGRHIREDREDVLCESAQLEDRQVTGLIEGSYHGATVLYYEFVVTLELLGFHIQKVLFPCRECQTPAQEGYIDLVKTFQVEFPKDVFHPHFIRIPLGHIYFCPGDKHRRPRGHGIESS